MLSIFKIPVSQFTVHLHRNNIHPTSNSSVNRINFSASKCQRYGTTFIHCFLTCRSTRIVGTGRYIDSMLVYSSRLSILALIMPLAREDVVPSPKAFLT